MLGVPPTVTTTSPVVAPVGTFKVSELLDQEVTVAGTPLNTTVLDPCAEPNRFPAIVTVAPTAAGFGRILVIVGISVTNRFAVAVAVVYPELVGAKLTDRTFVPTGKMTPAAGV